jgi:uncharacterized protein DUF6085
MSDFVRGHCPACGRHNLFVGQGGYLTCTTLACPRPDAVATLLEDREIEHVVEFAETTFTVKHPLRERLDDALMRCRLHDDIHAMSGPPVMPGRYRAVANAEGGWHWYPLVVPVHTSTTDTTEAVSTDG